MDKLKGMNLKCDKFLKILCEYYFKNFDKNSTDCTRNLTKFISYLPSLKDINLILSMKLITNIKEMCVFKVILDLYEHYLKNFDFPVFDRLLNEYFPVAELFYSEFSSNDFVFVYENLKEQNDLFEIMLKKLNIMIYKNPKIKIKNLKLLKENYIKLVGGIDYTKFYL